MLTAFFSLTYASRPVVVGAEHDDDAPVLAQVRYRLGLATDLVEVRNLPWADDPGPAEISLRLDVDVPGPLTSRTGRGDLRGY